MDIGKAIVLSAAIVAATGALTAYAIRPHYTMTNMEAGNALRLNQSSGDVMACAELSCWPIVRDDKPLDPWKNLGNEVQPNGS